MLPWGHFAVGYLSYSLGIRARYEHPLGGPAAIILVLATQLPDLIDKPLTTWFGVLPSGRSLGHSLLFVLVAGTAVWVLARRADWDGVGSAFGVGLLSHIVTDAIGPIRGGRWAELGHLLWPLTPAFEYGADENRIFSEYLLVELVSAPHHELVLFGLAVILWVYDGTPGADVIASWIGRGRSVGLGE